MRENGENEVLETEYWKELAIECEQKASDSWNSSDTDGFRSQAALTEMARRYRHMADISEHGNTVETRAVLDLDGNFVTMDQRQGQYGAYWFIPQNTGKAKFFKESYADSNKTARKNNAKKGYRMGTVTATVTLNEREKTPYDLDEFKSVGNSDWLPEEV